MGSSQSKKKRMKANGEPQVPLRWSAERLHHESIAAAIAANKRQRKLLIKQAKMSNNYRSQQSLSSSSQASPLYYCPEPTMPANSSSTMQLNLTPDSPINHHRHGYYYDAPYPVMGAAYANNPIEEDYNPELEEGHMRVRGRRSRMSGLSLSNLHLNCQPAEYARRPARRKRHQPVTAQTTTTTSTSNPLNEPARHFLSSRENLSIRTTGALSKNRQIGYNREANGPGGKAFNGHAGNGKRAIRSSYNNLSEQQLIEEPQLMIAKRQLGGQTQAPRRRRSRYNNHLARQQQQQQQQQHQQQTSMLRQHASQQQAAYNHLASSPPLASRHLQQQHQHNTHIHPVGRHSRSSLSLYSSHSSFTSNTIPLLPEPNFVPNSLYKLTQNQQGVFAGREYQQATMGTPANISSSCQQMYEQSRREKALAFNDDERLKLNLVGLLPAAKQDLSLQIRAVVNFVTKTCQDELSKYVYLRNLKDFNERLFYASLQAHVELLMPLVYTPTVGLACQKFSHIYMRPRGLFVSLNNMGQVPALLANWPEKDVRVIVVTDGERILGLGDLGANGMGISIGKLSLYTALAGIPPENVLPVTIDVGTNNKENLEDPFYIGLRRERVRGASYESLIDEFMCSVADRWGRSCLVQFEDFANATAFTLLQRYRNQYCTFNDDIQGTASVCLSGLLTASKLTGKRLADNNYLFYGAGEANLGTANLLAMAIVDESSISLEEAKSRIWLVDSKGLVVESRTDISGHKRSYARQNAPHLRELREIIEFAKPIAIVGASAQGGSFTEDICKLMAKINQKPIIFALSNPTSKAECTASQAYEWTQGRCIFASGSPFEPVHYGDKTYITGQGNNAYIFPAVGLAAIAAHVHTIPEDTFLVAAKALSDQVTSADSSLGLVYPRLNRIREVTLRVATRVLEHFYSELLATYMPEPNDKLNFLRSIQYDSRYEETNGSSSGAIEAAAANLATTFEQVSMDNQTVARANKAANLKH